MFDLNKANRCPGPVKSGHRCVLPEDHGGMHEVEVDPVQHGLAPVEFTDVPREVTALWEPCQCGLLDGEPHHHIDQHTLIPWDKFTESLMEFGRRGGGVALSGEAAEAVGLASKIPRGGYSIGATSSGGDDDPLFAKPHRKSADSGLCPGSGAPVLDADACGQCGQEFHSAGPLRAPVFPPHPSSGNAVGRAAKIDPEQVEQGHEILLRGPKIEYEREPAGRYRRVVGPRKLDIEAVARGEAPGEREVRSKLESLIDENEMSAPSPAKIEEVKRAMGAKTEPRGTLPVLRCVCGHTEFTAAFDETPTEPLVTADPAPPFALFPGAKGLLLLDCTNCTNRMSWPLAVNDRHELETHWTGPLAEDPNSKVPR